MVLAVELAAAQVLGSERCSPGQVPVLGQAPGPAQEQVLH